MAQPSPVLIVKEHYHNRYMDEPLEPGQYEWQTLSEIPGNVIDAMIEQKKAVWAGGEPPAEYLAFLEGSTEPEPEPIPDFLDMTVAELRAYAEAKAITIPSTATRKDDIIAVLEASLKG